MVNLRFAVTTPLMMRIHFILKKGINEKNKNKLICFLSKLVGALDIRQDGINDI